MEEATNNVSNLSSVNRRKKIILQQSDNRKLEFESLRNTMISNAPNLGREILKTDEFYDSNILKGSQESKRDNA